MISTTSARIAACLIALSASTAAFAQESDTGFTVGGEIVVTAKEHGGLFRQRHHLG